MKKILAYTLATGLAATAIFGGIAAFSPLSPPARADEKPTGKRLWAKSFLNQKAPGLVVEKWLSTTPNTQGKFVLIDFWATWCPPCRATIPELNSIQQQFAGKLVVIGVSDETEAKVRAFKNPQINYFSAIDTQARTKKAYAVTGIPHVVLIDPKGIVRWEGYPLLNGHELTSKVVSDIIAKYGS